MATSKQSQLSEVASQISWHMARHHGWGQWVPEDVVLTNGLKSDRVGFARQEVIPSVKRGKIRILNYRSECLRLRGDEPTTVAYFLRDIGGYDEFQIECTVSRFPGFDETEEPDVVYIG
jgi:hypothetical protein